MSTSTRVTGRKLPLKILSQIAADLQAGAVVIFPTETVYGIGTNVFSRAGIQRIYKLKGRHDRKPLALLVPTLAAARPLVDIIPPEAERLAKRFWPGPLTLVLQASPLGRLVTGGTRDDRRARPRPSHRSGSLETRGDPFGDDQRQSLGPKTRDVRDRLREALWISGGLAD